MPENPARSLEDAGGERPALPAVAGMHTTASLETTPALPAVAGMEASAALDLADLAETLDLVDICLARLDAGTYGTCATCGIPLPEPLLEADPLRQHCSMHDPGSSRDLRMREGPGPLSHSPEPLGLSSQPAHQSTEPGAALSDIEDI